MTVTGINKSNEKNCVIMFSSQNKVTARMRKKTLFILPRNTTVFFVLTRAVDPITDGKDPFGPDLDPV